MENRQVLTIARLRAEAEETYGQRLSDITPSADRVNGGFSRDDGATVRKVSLFPSFSILSCIYCLGNPTHINVPTSYLQQASTI